MATQAEQGRPPAAEPPARPSASLEVLLSRVACGDEEAFEAVYDQVAGPVYGIVHRAAAGPGQAQEMTQDILVQVWRSASRFTPAAGSGMSWVLGITRQHLARQRAMTAVRQDGPTAGHDRPRPSPTMPSALDGLPDRQRQALVLAVHESRAAGEIADRLGVTPGEAAALLREGLLAAAQDGNR